MKRVMLASLWMMGFGLLSQAGLFGQISDPPKTDDKIKIFCPVVGLPDAKGCGCGSGYCPRHPNKHDVLDLNGAKVQFCCGACVDTFKKTPAKFAVTVHHQLVATKQAEQRKCPLCAGETGKGKTVLVAGVSVALCSEECAKTIGSASAAERANLVFGEKGFARGFVVKGAQKN